MEENKKPVLNKIEEAKKLIETEMQNRTKAFAEDLEILQKKHRCTLSVIVPFKDRKTPIDAILKLPVAIDIVPLP